MPKYIPLAFEINLQPEGFMFDVGSLFETLWGCMINGMRADSAIRSRPS